MVERCGGLEPPCQKAIDESVVEVQPFLIDRAAALWQDTRPACREAVDVGTEVADQVEVRLHPVIVVAGHGTVLGAHHVSRRGSEIVPVGAAGAAEGMTFDLVA